MPISRWEAFRCILALEQHAANNAHERKYMKGLNEAYAGLGQGSCHA